MSSWPISFSKTSNPKTKPQPADLGFGRFFTDHMFTARYTAKGGWQDAKVVPYQPLLIDPGASVLHYGQALFEGMKAFRQANGQNVLFRPAFNWKRMEEGADRLCMPAPPKELFVEGVRAVVRADQDWIPDAKGSSLYIRPTLIGTEAFLGVRPAEELLFFVILSPVGSYYSGGLTPVKIWIEQKYLRAAPGGLGATKAAANYAGSLKAALEAKKRGYTQVLWLDVEREHVEEVGTMNVFFVFDDEIVTPDLHGTILGGGIRDSILTLLKNWNLPVRERKLTISEIREGAKSGRLKEAFGSGTAAVVTPIGELGCDEWKVSVGNGQMGELTTKLYNELTAIQYGEKPDPFGWIEPV